MAPALYIVNCEAEDLERFCSLMLSTSSLFGIYSIYNCPAPPTTCSPRFHNYDSANHQSKNPQKFPKAKLEFAAYWQLFALYLQLFT